MNRIDLFKQTLSEGRHQKEARQAAQCETARLETLRLDLNFRVVEDFLNETVLPAFRDAREVVSAMGGYAHIAETRMDGNRGKALCLMASFQASATRASQPPQTFLTLAYEGHPDALDFDVTVSGRSHEKFSLPEITPDLVAAQVAEFLKLI